MSSGNPGWDFGNYIKEIRGALIFLSLENKHNFRYHRHDFRDSRPNSW